MEIQFQRLDFHWDFKCQAETSKLFTANATGKILSGNLVSETQFSFQWHFCKLICQLFTNMPPKWKSSFKNSISTGILSARLRLQNYLRPMTLEKFLVEIEFLKLDFLFSGIFVNWSASLFKNMPPKWKSSFKDLIFIGFFFFFLQLLLQQ